MWVNVISKSHAELSIKLKLVSSYSKIIYHFISSTSTLHIKKMQVVELLEFEEAHHHQVSVSFNPMAVY